MRSNKIEERKTARDWDQEPMKVLRWSTAEPMSTCVSEEQTETAPGIRIETDLVENLRSDETVRFPCGGCDETYPAREMFV